MPFLLAYWKYIAVAAILAGLVIFYNSHVNGLIKDAETKAVISRDASWRESEQAAIAKSRAEAQAQEAAHAKDLAAIQDQHRKDIASAKAKHDKDVADARSGALSLRIPSNCPSSGNVSGSPGDGNPAAATSELPREITASLFSIADDADALVTELNSCWQIAASDRKVSP